MQNNPSLRKLSFFVLLILLLIAGAFGFGAYRVNIQVDTINKAWLSFKSQHAEKARLETRLRAALGYGGMIHDFKNYVLRKDFETLSRLQRSLGAAQTIVAQYQALSTTQAERLVLEDIGQMLSKYQEGFAQARSEIQQGKSSMAIDSLVRIEDGYALRGLKVLHEEIVAEHSYYDDQQQKPVLANAIRARLGYGGMIHAFKNYVLRGEEQYLAEALLAIQDVQELILKYRNLEIGLGEKTALEDIENTLHEYEDRIKTVEELVHTGILAEEIDRAVRVADDHALRGLRTLDQDIILQIESKSDLLSRQLIDISKQESVISYLVVSAILLVAVYLYLVFTNRIIRPVLQLSHVMTEIAKGNTEVEYYYPVNAKTELGKIARSLQIFKQSEAKRKEAEEEVRKLAMTDPLTGLANRNRFEIRFREMISHAKRENKLIAVFALDLDKFKPVNDEYGHAAGDSVLKNVATNLLLAFRDTDLVARTGGDEFLIILYAPENLDTVKNAAQRVLNLLGAPIEVDGQALGIGASIGIALHAPAETATIHQVVRRADAALYQAKEAGRNTYRIDGVEGNHRNLYLPSHSG